MSALKGSQESALEGVRGLVAMNHDDQLLLNLRKNVIYVILQDFEDKERKPLAKVIDISGRQTLKPDNNTAAVLLYLLARDDADDVLLSDFLSFINDKLPERTKAQAKESKIDIEASIRTFLDHLETFRKILKTTVVPKGTQGANIKDLDPVGLLASLPAWEVPTLTQTDPAIVKSNTYYSTGYGPVNVHR